MTNKTPSLKFTAACFTIPRFSRNQYSFECLHSEGSKSKTSYYHSSHSFFYRPENLDRDLIDWFTSIAGTFRHKANKVNEIYTNKNSGISLLLMSAVAAESRGSFRIRPRYKVYDSVMLAIGSIRGSKEYGYDTSVCGDVGIISGGIDKLLQLSCRAEGRDQYNHLYWLFG